MASRTWTCRGCSRILPRIKQKCPDCGRSRPAPSKPRHQLVLDVPYERWVDAFGERCGICGRPPGPNRKLDRDHDHRTGMARGLCCHIHNRLLNYGMTPEILRRAADYLERPQMDLLAGEEEAA